MLCAQCGLRLPGDGALCWFHPMAEASDWSRVNRIMCNFFHRKEELPRVKDNDGWVDYVITGELGG